MNLFDGGGDADQNQQLSIVGKVVAIYFESPDSFYKVLSVSIQEANFDWDSDDIVVVGDFGDVDVDSKYRFLGRLVDHPKYGQQFRVTNYAPATPKTTKGMVSYLTSDAFPGIGAKTAERIVAALGDDLVQTVLTTPERLKTLAITEKQRQTLIDGVQKNDGVEQVIIGLNNYGFGSSLAAKIYNRYKGDTLAVIRQNPYQLVEDIKGISFRKADQIADQMGIADNSNGRLRAGIMTALDQLSLKSGGTYTDLRLLCEEASNLLNSSRAQQVTFDEIGAQIVALAKNNKIASEGHHVYLRSLYQAEWTIAESIQQLMKTAPKESEVDDQQLTKLIRQIELENQIRYDASQIDALKQAMHSPIFLLTGGPGTGKTTIIKGILALYAKMHGLSLSIKDYDDDYPFVLAAPTGRAAKRMQETTGAEASTIHRLLGLTINDDPASEQFETAQISGRLLIVDEMSMVDTYLFRRLIQAVPSGMKVILVGDRDQLPSVGPGQVFNDLLASKTIPSLELNKIHRQDDQSTITELAHAIKAGRLPEDFTVNQTDRSFILCEISQLQSVISQVVEHAKNSGFNASQMQVLAPMYKGIGGVNSLNRLMQDIMNPKTSARQKEVEFRNTRYRIGDKVLQLVNSPEHNVFNGDMGKIVSIEQQDNSSNDKLVVAFEDAEVTYQRKDWDQITLAYCTTIHKAQGSEFKMVILPVVHQYSRMLKRNLLYTAITRAAKFLIMTGEYDSFQHCVQDNATSRHTSLTERLRAELTEAKPEHRTAQPTQSEAAPAKNAEHVEPTSQQPVHNGPYQLSVDAIQNHSIDPMIGMDGVTPADFMD